MSLLELHADLISCAHGLLSYTEEMISQHRETEMAHMVQEVQMTTDRTFHFMAVL